MSNNIGSEPIFYVLIQPEGLTERDRIDTTDTVLSFEFEDDEKKADLLKLEVDNWDLSNFDDPLWKPGNHLIVTWGYPGRMAPSRDCIIQKVEGSTKLTITAQSKAVLMNKAVFTKLYENTTRSEIVHAIAKDYGYGDAQRDIEETETMYEHISQSRMTDAQFIKKLADAEHFEFYVDFDGFHWHSRRLGGKPRRVYQYYIPPDVGDVLSFEIENNIFAKPGKVTTKGRDPLKKADVGGEGSNATTTRDALGPVPEILDEATGAITLQTHSASSDTRPTTETSGAQAKKEADGAFKRAILTTVKLSLDLVGDPGTFAKCVVEVKGISKRLSGLYYVNKAVHKIDSSGYKLKINCTTDGTNGHSQNLIDIPKPSAATLEACKRDAAAKMAELAKAALAPDTARLKGELAAINARCAALAAALSKATPNDGKGASQDADAAVRKEALQPDGTTAIEYHTDAKEDPK